MKKNYILIVVLLLSIAQVYGQTITTLAGDGIQGFLDGPGNLARFAGPNQLAIDNENNIYVVDRNNNVIRKIAPDGLVSTYAGTGEEGNADGYRLDAEFYEPQGICFDKQNNYLYVSDTGNDLIRRIDEDGNVETIAGSSFGFADGPLLLAQFYNPIYITVDFKGNLYVADIDNERIRKIDLEKATVITIGGDGNIGYEDGEAANSRFNRPRGVVVDNELNVYVADQENHAIRKISPDGIVSTLAGDGIPGYADGSVEESRFWGPKGVSIDEVGNLYISDRLNFVVRKIDTDNMVSTVAGQPGITGYKDGTLEEGLIGRAVFALPFGSDKLLITDWENDVIRLVDFNGVLANTEELDSKNADVFPNPSKDIFHISSDKTIVEYSLYNTQKTLIRKGNPTDENRFIVDLTDYENGVYYLLLHTKDKVMTKRLIKL